jgi:hypothetical protein
MRGATGVTVGSGAAIRAAPAAAEATILWPGKRFCASAAPGNENAILERISALSYVGRAAAAVPLATPPSRAATAAIETAARLCPFAADEDS